MAKPELGIKRVCQSCGARYYDFLRIPIVCPSCETEFDSEAVLKSRRARPLPVDDAPKKARTQTDEAAKGKDDDDVEDTDDDEEDDVDVPDLLEADEPDPKTDDDDYDSTPKL